MLSNLYLQIGFTRKAAFCQRLAATRYVSPQNPTPNWNQCYNLILQSFPGHKITLDPTEMCMSEIQMGKFYVRVTLGLVKCVSSLTISFLSFHSCTSPYPYPF